MREYLSSGEVLRPPSLAGGSEYDSSGGAWVSLRSREDIYDRLARDGFWHFPGEPSWGVAEDIVRAAFRAAGELPRGGDRLKLVESCYIAVTLFSALKRVTVGELDNDRYGIVVVSKERPETMGGALPRMPGIRDEWQQFRHARYNNAGLYPFEPYILYRHEVAKFVEPSAPWQPSGVAGSEEGPDLGCLAAWVLDLAQGHDPAEPLAIPEFPPGPKQIFVTIYIDGEVRGCMGSDIGDVSTTLRTLTQAAMADERFADVLAEDDSTIAASVSLLYNELEMGDFSREEVRLRYKHGQQALMLEQNSRAGLLLPFVAARMSLDAEDFVDEVIDKAGITRQPYNWKRFDCITWLADQDGVSKLEGGFKQSAPMLGPREIARLHVEYLLRNQRQDGSFYFGYYPFNNTLYQGIDAARQAHAAWTLARAGLIDAAVAALKYAQAQPEDGPLALSRDAFVLLALCEPGVPPVSDRAAIAEKLLATINRHGRIETWQPPSDQAPEQDTIDPEELQNYAPGQVLLALAAVQRTGAILADGKLIQRAFRYHRHRFRYKRDFGQVSWMALAAAAWARLTSQREYAELVFEIAAWILEFQHSTSGAFLTDHQPDTPGFTTAVYLEAVAAAIHIAVDFDPSHRRRYEDAWRRGFVFLDRLIIQDRDSSVLPNSGYASGGLRENSYSGHVRIDFVQHSLAAILERYPDLFATTPTPQENRNG